MNLQLLDVGGEVAGCAELIRTGQHSIKDRSQAEHIGPLVHFLARLGLLGCHVGQSAELLPGV